MKLPFARGCSRMLPPVVWCLSGMGRTVRGRGDCRRRRTRRGPCRSRRACSLCARCGLGRVSGGRILDDADLAGRAEHLSRSRGGRRGSGRGARTSGRGHSAGTCGLKAEFDATPGETRRAFFDFSEEPDDFAVFVDDGEIEVGIGKLGVDRGGSDGAERLEICLCILGRIVDEVAELGFGFSVAVGIPVGRKRVFVFVLKSLKRVQIGIYRIEFVGVVLDLLTDAVHVRFAREPGAAGGGFAEIDDQDRPAEDHRDDCEGEFACRGGKELFRSLFHCCTSVLTRDMLYVTTVSETILCCSLAILQ